MCGIAGQAGDFERRSGLVSVGALNCLLALRRPDAEGLESWPGAVLVFSGVIYNFREIRLELEQAAYQFRKNGCAGRRAGR